MNNETTQPITVDTLKQRRAHLSRMLEICDKEIQTAEDRRRILTGRLQECDFLLGGSDPTVSTWTIAVFHDADEPVLTPAEEAAARDRAMRAHAEELAKGNAALDDAITQVERKNGKPKLRDDARNYYGLVPGKTYSQGDIAKRWGWTWGRKLSQARQFGYVKSPSAHQPFIYKADDLIEWRNMGAPHKKPKVFKIKKK